MDEVDAVPRPRKQRPRDSFQNELKSTLKQRKTMGLSADLSDTDEDGLGPEISDYSSMRGGRPGSAIKRPEHSSTLKGGLGTTTMGARDLTQLLGHSKGRYDDDDEEVMAANYGRSSGGRHWQSSGLKTPSPTQDLRLSNRTPTFGSPKDQTGKLDSIFGRKTPTKESPTSSKSPQTGLTKEEIIFGRKTPGSDGKRSPNDKRLPGVDGEKWQPPNFRSVSPSSSIEHSRGSRGVTPIDSMLGTISETPREKVTPRIQRSQGPSKEVSPRQTSYGQMPKPQARGSKGDVRVPLLAGDRKTPPIAGERKTPPIAGERKTPPLAGERKTPPITDPRKKTSLLKGEPEGQMKRTTPTLDLFGKSRAAAAQELDSYINKEDQYASKQYKSEKQLGYSRGKAAVNEKGSISSPAGRLSNNRTQSPVGRKTPTSKEKALLEKKSPEEERRLDKPGASLLDFLMDDGSANRPKPKERGRLREGRGQDSLAGEMFAPNRKPSLRSKSPTGRVSPGFQRRKSQEFDKGTSNIIGQPEEMFKSAPEPQRPEDTSSLCEDIPADPNKKIARDEQQARKSGMQITERAKADSAIDTIAEAQTMTFIEPAKKMRPFTANAKVQHRPKPRYGTLPGTAQPLQERQFNSTGDIRDAIYEEWYHERLKSAKKKKKVEDQKKQKEEEEKKKMEVEKRLEAEASYKAWMSKKKETLLIEKEKKEEEEIRKKEKERQEAEEKKLESIKSFQHWKQKKDAMIKRELHRKTEAKEMEEEEKRREEMQKQKERETAFRGWKIKKDRVYQQKSSEKRLVQKTLRQKEEEEKEELRRKEDEAMERYYKWLEQKERQTKQEKKKAKQRKLMGEDEFRPAFRPASRTIPFGH
ncbi:microtubule-associated protein 9-like [Plakobranchus ocellatus]|uniref:Microtubule-associated protein 9-like n=1 Tax=Plakobranchus ocellatus TaxID=259542 RepID=A0AAV3YLF2_9GAST|nr:microtubule-associated protein 9-like [Plakobranchus ocellatus]